MKLAGIQRKLGYMIIAILFLLCIGTFLISTVQVSTNSRREARQEPVIRSSNRTRGLQILSIDRLEEPRGGGAPGKPLRVRLTLRNDYDKNVTAFALSAVSYRIRVDFTPDPGLAPGATHVESFTLPPIEEQPTLDGQEVVVLAAVLEGGVAEGDESVIRDINDTRKGKTDEAAVVLQQLNKLMTFFEMGEERFSSALDEAEAAFQKEPIYVPGQSFEYQSGRRDARASALEQIKQLKLLKAGFGGNELTGIDRHQGRQPSGTPLLDCDRF